MSMELLRERKRTTEPEDLYVTTRIPSTDFTVYPELIIALSSIEEEFICTMLTEEERKEAIHLCPKNYLISSKMHEKLSRIRKPYRGLHQICAQNFTYSKGVQSFVARNNHSQQ
ncbi:hypothetical protein AYI69_g11474 [Smittium culicis]|uniref:Uncharacterized protein n=1 Tax=Smittium culicis TaxID=133412 RepID=A0A1R1WYC2_9FUNG|nr:hypothetical protein AYI69_g11474 [Smittium culicis]